MGTTPGNRAVIFAFGKHPAWDDHVQEIGILNESIALAKTILYVNGIGRIIDSGDWEKAEPEKIATGFDHAFVWFRKNEFLIGRFWPSTDGKGRSRYPMLLGCHLKNVTLDFAFKQVVPKLDTLEKKCRSTTDRNEVLAAVSQTQSEVIQLLSCSVDRAKLETALPKLAPGTSILPSAPLIEQAEDGWARLFYQIQSQLIHYANWSFNPKCFTDGSLSAQVLRLPLLDSSFEKSVAPWLHFLQRQIHPSLPVLLVAAQQMAWLDAIIGQPGMRELLNLKLSLKGFPYPHTIPYSIKDSFREIVRATMEGLAAGKPATETCIFGKPGFIKRKWLALGRAQDA